MHEYSFIIPAYNSERTISDAIKSVEEKMPGAEIIVVENGSTDNTYEVVKRLSDTSQDIILLQSEKGVSEARNKGIKKATGKWIIFVDADDQWVGEEKYLRHLIASLPDIAFCSYLKGKGQVVFNFPSTDVQEIRKWLMSRPTQRMTIWAKVYRRNFLVENGLLFNTSLRVSEDSEFLVRCMNVCRKALVSPTIIYDNHLDRTSVTRTIDQGRAAGHLDAMRLVEQMVPGDESLMEYILAHINLIAVHDIFNCEIKCSWRDRIRQIKRLINEDVMKRQLKKLRFTTNLQLLPSFLFKNKLYSLGGLICYLRSVNNSKMYKSE